MGTSTSSGGGKGGSPFDPEWLDQGAGGDGDGVPPAPGDGNGPPQDPGDDAAGDGDSDAGDGVGVGEGAAQEVGNPDFAPGRRFAPARSKLSNYLGGGGRDALRGAAKSMVSKGMGGSGRAASTMRGTAQGAGRLGAFLEAIRDGTDARIRDWVQRVRGANLSANDLALELIREVMPDTGSIDDESLRNSAADAMAMLYEQDPQVDIFSLSDQQIADVIGYTIANEVCNRMDLQLGQTYEKLKHQPREIQALRNDIKEWVHGEVRSVMEQILPRQLDPQGLAQAVLETALGVFAE